MKIIMTMAAILVLLNGVSFGQNSYSQDFSSDPMYDLSFEPDEDAGEFVGVENGHYRMRLMETTTGVYKFAFTDSLTLGIYDNVDFHVSCDIMLTESSYGFPHGFRLCDLADPYGTSITIHFQGAHANNMVQFSDGHGNEYALGNATPNKWFRYEFSYNHSEQLVDVVMTDMDTGVDIGDFRGVPFTPNAFNAVGFGIHTINGDGTWATLCYDNLLVESEFVVSTEERSWGSLKALFR